MSNDDWVFGLNIMNIALAVVVGLPLLLVLFAWVCEFVTGC